MAWGETLPSSGNYRIVLIIDAPLFLFAGGGFGLFPSQEVLRHVLNPWLGVNGREGITITTIRGALLLLLTIHQRSLLA